MSDSSITLLEVHLGEGDVAVGPFELFGASDGSTETEADADESDADGGETAADERAPATGGSGGGPSVRSLLGLALALGALVAVAVGVAKLRGDEEVPSGIAGDEE